MRKYLIISLVLVLIGALYYVSASYYMSVQVKSKIENIVNHYKSVNSNLSINLKEYNKGIFTSKAKLEIQYDNFSPFYADLKIIHRPILAFKDDNNKFKLYFNKLLINSRLSQVFLEKNTELLHNVSIIDPNGKIKIKLKLNGMSRVLYKLLGFYSNDKQHADANTEISFNNGSLDILLTGQGVNLLSDDSEYNLATSEFKIYLHFLVNETSASQTNNYQIEIHGKNLTSTNQATTKISLSNPRLKLDLTGDFFYFLEAMKHKKNLVDLIVDNQAIQMKIRLENKLSKLTTIYEDETKIDDFVLGFDLNNSDKDKKINLNLNFKKLGLQSSTDQLAIGNVALNFNSDLEGDLFDKNRNSQKICLPSVTGNKCLSDGFRPINMNLDFTANNLFIEGLIAGKFNINKLQSKFELQEQQSKAVVIKNKIKLDNLNWNLNDTNLKVGINKLNFDFNGDLNLTEYFADLMNKDRQPYNAKYIYNISVPNFRLTSADFNILLAKLVGKGDFLLNRELKGYLHNNLEMTELKFGNKRTQTQLTNFQLSSAMVQKYKFILTGTNKLTADSLTSNMLNDDLVINNLLYMNTSEYAKSKLSYKNDLNLTQVNYGKVSYGKMTVKNKFFDISLDDYQAFLSVMNYVFLDEMLNNKLNNTQQNDKILEAMVNFLITGFGLDNKIQLGNDGGIKIYNVVRLKNLTMQKAGLELVDNKIASVKDNADVAFNIILKKAYVEKILKLFNIAEVNNFYNNIQKMGLLEYKEKDVAKLKILYIDKKIIINNQSLEYWQKKLQKKKINAKYFEQLNKTEQSLTQ